MDCADVRDDRLDALYGEASEQALRLVAAHHAECATCRSEFEALRGVRRRMAEWRLPQAEPAVARRRLHPLVGLAAAAGLVVAAAAALRISGLAFEYNAGPVRVSAGGHAGTAELRAQQARVRADIDAMRTQLASMQPSGQPALPESLLERVEQRLSASEERQAGRLRAELQGLAARSEAQRRYDLARVSAGLSYLDGKNGQQVARTNELMGYLLQASQDK